MGRPGYSRRHWEMVSPRADTAKDIEDRRLMGEAKDAANAALDAKYPEINQGNAAEALDYFHAMYSHERNIRGIGWVRK